MANTVWVQEVPFGVRDGVNVSFTLSQTPVANSVILVLNGLVLWPFRDYSLDLNEITFDYGNIPGATDTMFAQYQTVQQGPSL